MRDTNPNRIQVSPRFTPASPPLCRLARQLRAASVRGVETLRSTLLGERRAQPESQTPESLRLCWFSLAGRVIRNVSSGATREGFCHSDELRHFANFFRERLASELLAHLQFHILGNFSLCLCSTLSKQVLSVRFAGAVAQCAPCPSRAPLWRRWPRCVPREKLWLARLRNQFVPLHARLPRSGR